MLFLGAFLLSAGALQPPRAHLAPSLLPTPTGGSLSRRAALLAVPLALVAPQSSSAVCVCKTATDCECTANAALDGDATRLGAKKNRADAAGRDTFESRKEVIQMRDEALSFDEIATSKARAKANPNGGQQQASKQVSAGASDPRDMLLARGALTGGGSQNYNDINQSAAKRRFQEILVDTVIKREQEYGFELDANDIKQIESVLRIKYCGKEGLIGPC